MDAKQPLRPPPEGKRNWSLPAPVFSPIREKLRIFPLFAPPSLLLLKLNAENLRPATNNN